MVTAKFGSKQFQVTSKLIYTPSDFSISESIDLEETERSGKKPTTKVKGIKLQTVSFTVLLDARFVTVATEIQWWKNTLRAKSPKDLYYGNNKIGKFYLTQYDASEINVNKRGEYTKAKLNLSFTEYDGTTKSTSSSSSASSVKSSATTKSSKQVKTGSVVKPKSGTRYYETYNDAIKKKTGHSKKVSSKEASTNIKVNSTVSQSGKVVAVQINKVWMRIEDVTVVSY